MPKAQRRLEKSWEGTNFPLLVNFDAMNRQEAKAKAELVVTWLKVY
jgi:hypothetical protein